MRREYRRGVLTVLCEKGGVFTVCSKLPPEMSDSHIRGLYVQFIAAYVIHVCVQPGSQHGGKNITQFRDA